MVLLTIAGAASVTQCVGGQGHALVLRQSPPPLPPAPPVPQAYLLRVGPPGLRFETSGPSENAAAPTHYSLAEPKPANIKIPSSETAADAAKISSAPTNAAPTALVTVKTGPVLPAPSSNAENFAPSVADLTIVTPEMLAEYLKPAVPGKDNSNPAVVVPAKLGFTPPTPVADNQSRAVYKNE
jgi:hypothetical protein